MVSRPEISIYENISNIIKLLTQTEAVWQTGCRGVSVDLGNSLVRESMLLAETQHGKCNTLQSLVKGVFLGGCRDAGPSLCPPFFMVFIRILSFLHFCAAE